MSENASFVSFKVMKDLTTLRHFSERTIRDCIAQILHQYKKSLSDEELEQTFDAVVAALDRLGWRVSTVGENSGN